MRHRLRPALTIVLSVALAALPLSGCASARGPRKTSDLQWDWSRVYELEPGTPVVVTARSSQQIAGSFLSADATSFVVQHGKVAETIARDDILEITGQVVTHGSIVAAVLGGWLGFAVGVVPGLGGAPPALAWSIVAAAVAGGAYLGYHGSGRAVDGIVYRAP